MRDGLGRTRLAGRVAVDTELGVALVVADTPFGPAWPMPTAARDALSGSPAWVATCANGARAMLPGVADAAAPASAALRAAPDAIDESAMRLALQVVVAD